MDAGHGQRCGKGLGNSTACLNDGAKTTQVRKGPTMARIKHIALYTEGPDEQADFYCKAFDLNLVDTTNRYVLVAMEICR